MKMMKGFLVVLAVMLFCSVSLAEPHGKSDKEDFRSKVIGKAHLMLINQEELGLSEEQIKQIKDIKINLKKDMIQQGAQIEILAVDIMAALWADKVDKEAVDKLIDNKYDLKKARAKELVTAYVKLNEVLNEDQAKEMKSLCMKMKQHKQGWSGRKSGK
ncbi:MAG: hypothetical protein P9M03_01110 [Candidatus Theseobacter exili]|nr:hypothetical protein [Candidatus Theseobacter exili]